jgi:dipeptidyl aminopeptidase/acylaminoacyl peptidase
MIAFERYSESANRSEVFVIDADGTDEHPLFAAPPPGRGDEAPDWSPSGDRIAFARNGDLFTVTPAGSALTQLTTGTTVDNRPDWSPSGARIAFDRYAPGTDTPANVWHMSANGGDEVQYLFVPEGSFAPTWAPDGGNMAFTNGPDVWVTRPTPPGRTNLTSGSGTDTLPDWQRVAGYPRPKGATPMYVSFVTAYQPCTAPNREHGPPLAFGSCSPTQPTSAYLVPGTADVNGKPPRNEGYLVLRAIPGVISTPADEADASIEFFSDDIFTKTPLADYAGELRASFRVRATDRNNAPSPTAGTTYDFSVAFSAPCTPNPDDLEGSACALSTTVDALIPGAIAEGKRSVWQVTDARVFDGGADGDGDTTADNTLFATQGIFIP